MIRLIITANDELYAKLGNKARAEGDIPMRATNVLDGFRQAMAPKVTHKVAMIIVDISLHAADTLIETLHSRQATSTIPLLAVESGERLPFELRRFCTDVLGTDTL